MLPRRSSFAFFGPLVKVTTVPAPNCLAGISRHHDHVTRPVTQKHVGDDGHVARLTRGDDSTAGEFQWTRKGVPTCEGQRAAARLGQREDPIDPIVDRAAVGRIRGLVDRDDRWRAVETVVVDAARGASQ